VPYAIEQMVRSKELQSRFWQTLRRQRELTTNRFQCNSPTSPRSQQGRAARLAGIFARIGKLASCIYGSSSKIRSTCALALAWFRPLAKHCFAGAEKFSTDQQTRPLISRWLRGDTGFRKATVRRTLLSRVAQACVRVSKRRFAKPMFNCDWRIVN
jgi:hypothetical protein